MRHPDQIRKHARPEKLVWAEFASRAINLPIPSLCSLLIVSTVNPLNRVWLCLPALLLTAAGCLSPQRIQYPRLGFSSEEAQRRAAQVQDPYPDASAGPQVDFRPLGFVKQRSMPQQTKDRFYSGFLKSQFGGPQPRPNTTGAAPMMGPALASPRGAVVVQQAPAGTFVQQPTGPLVQQAPAGMMVQQQPAGIVTQQPMMMIPPVAQSPGTPAPGLSPNSDSRVW
jgi:hypothetical protein